MKNLFILFIAFLLLQFNTLAQEGWFMQNPVPPGMPYEAVDFVNELTGWAVGSRGTIVKTTDGGTTWVLQTSGTYTGLKDVCFTDSDNGTVVGFSTMLGSIILRTTDGGANWISQLSGVPWVSGVSFTDSNNGTVVGGDGTILRTTDGGLTWISQTSGTTDRLWSVCFTDSDIGTVVGDCGILRTTDGGTTWILQTSAYTG